MSNVIPKPVVLAGLVIALAQCAYAAPTGLNVIPTADVLGHNEVALEYENEGVKLFGSHCEQWALLQIGLFDRLELGVDRCFGGEPGTFGNAKVLLQEEEHTRPAVAVGVQNLGEGESAQPYLALAKHAAGARLHLGAIRLHDEAAVMVGVEYELSHTVALLIDHVTGTESVSGAGFDVELSEHLEIHVARIFSHSSHEEDGWQFRLGFETAAGF